MWQVLELKNKKYECKKYRFFEMIYIFCNFVEYELIGTWRKNTKNTLKHLYICHLTNFNYYSYKEWAIVAVKRTFVELRKRTICIDSYIPIWIEHESLL